MASAIHNDYTGDTIMIERVRKIEQAWEIIRGLTTKTPFTLVTPVDIAQGKPAKYFTPLVLYAAPYQFELCYVRADRAPGDPMMIIYIQEPTHHDNAATDQGNPALLLPAAASRAHLNGALSMRRDGSVQQCEGQDARVLGM